MGKDMWNCWRAQQKIKYYMPQGDTLSQLTSTDLILRRGLCLEKIVIMIHHQIVPFTSQHYIRIKTQANCLYVGRMNRKHCVVI